ncbi:class I SAM-dependent methyltransferase [Salipiger mucosus]|uniref:Ribosomal RNA small subunit methyltransferase C n=1 Tax=Salipiger mucosus DSM 16094 TaxID=1123237 RepID=S9RP24_9RHOB|nr:class I SAM-dependent methyltransferase [Salipiger mucosus]EPX75749.1 Ribosomal RNA small subunit methyltransferase C [Salipiger mucosus DSM 16094]
MTTDRLTHASEAGLPLPDDGRILLIGPPGDQPLGPLPADRCDVVQAFKPDHDAWARRGLPVAAEPEGTDYSAAVVWLPRARELGEARVAQACAAAAGGLIVVDGQKTDGIEAMGRALRGRVDLAGQVSKAHGKTFWFTAADDFADWNHGPEEHDGIWTAPGVFSADGPDPATEALLAALPRKIGKRVADLGAGWGGLARGLLAREELETLHLVEADHAALECARRNVTDPRAVFHWADATAWEPPATIDSVIMNPPFHVGRHPDPTLGQAFITAAARMLPPGGRLWLVANRHLPYETTLAERFRHSEEIAGDSRFKILHAARPGR